MTGAELRRLREKAGLSRPKLAALSGLHPDTVKYWEAKPFVPGWNYGPSRMLAALGQKVPERRSRSAVATRQERWPQVFLSAIALPALFIYWL